MAMVRKKQDDKYLEALRELITTGGGNRQCFDCGQKGPTYVNMTIGSFVCTRCSGVLRGITPPHRVKSISMATFTQDEIDYLKAHGNDVCAKTWLGLWDPKRAVHQDQRELMIDKYERKRYYLEPASPLKSLTNATNLKTTTAAATTSSTASTSAIATASLGNNSQNNNSKTQIQLTPPTSQRTTANGLHKTSSTAISRPQHITPQPQNGFSSSLSSHNTDAFGLHNGLNSSVGSMSTGALSDTSSCASANGFGAEADFVADFGSADIFNATVASSPASSIGSSKTNNGYAKIQPMKMSAAAAAHQQFMNGHGGGGGGGSVGNNITNLQNGNPVNGINGNTENFADFDHAPIYNAAVEETPNYQFVRKNAIRKKSTSSVSGSIIRRNERQLKDILEMDNNENARDYINFNDDDAFAETRNAAQSGGYSNLFDDFDTLLTLDEDSRQKTNFKAFESDYANVDLDHMTANGSSSKFTPLALAAHATAMAVLGNQSHFNSQIQTAEHNRTSKQFTNEWDVWSSSKDMETRTKTTTKSNTSAASNLWFPSNHRYEVPQQQQQQHHQQQQQHLYASIMNFNSHLEHPQQYFPSSALSTQTLTQFDTGKTILPTAATSVAIITPTPTTKMSTSTTTTTATSMLNKNTINTTNPFRMHLDVNDNYNTVNYDNDYYFHNYNTTNITPTTTTTTTSNTDFNINNNNFDFVTNSILSYDFDIFSTATTSLTTNTFSSSSFITTTTTTTPPPPSLSTQNYYSNNDNDNCYLQSKTNNDDHDDNEDNNNDDDVLEDKQILKNPFLTSLNNSKPQKNHLSNAHQFSNHQSTYSTTSTTSYSTATSTVSCIVTSDKNPFRSGPPSDHEYNYNFNYDSNYNNENNIAAGKDVANNFCPKTNYNYLNSNCNFKSFCNTNTNANQNPNSCLNENENSNNNNNSWRLPNNNKSSTTNGFNNINNNNNNINNIINNNNSSAPAEDRYAALKDLDEQLRESKAVAAQAASIVTANVVDSGFGNPNVNGTVNPFGTHHHNHQQTAVVNPFQNASNNTATQNTTQQLFGQMTLIPNGIAAANGFLNAQKTHTVNTGFFNYTASGFTNANTPQIQQQQHQASLLYPTSVQTGPNGCGFGFGTLQQQIASTGTGLTTNSFNNPFAATGALNSNNPFL